MEIWNLVFMQFDRSSDGKLELLPKPSIDTGMGLERIACVLQGVLSNYDTDLFVPLLEKAKELTSDESDHTDLSEKDRASLRIIADHARAATFLISDGVRPANEGRGYVLRKILRRGIRHGKLLGQDQPFMFEMVKAVRDEMKVAYPELVETAERVSKTVLGEEEQFARVLEVGSRELDAALQNLTARQRFGCTKPSGCRSTLWLTQRVMPGSTSTCLVLKQPSRKNRSVRAHPGKAGRRRRRRQCTGSLQDGV